MITSGAEVGLEGGGQGGQVGRGIAHDEPGLAVAGKAGVHGAGLASFLNAGEGVRGDADAGAAEEVGDSVLLLVEGKRLDGAGEVFDGKHLTIGNHDGNADNIHLRVEKVTTVAGRSHPQAVDDVGAFGFGDVFRDEREADAGAGSALGKLGLSGEAMGDVAVAGHLDGVEGGRLRKEWIALDRVEAAGDAVLVGLFNEQLLGDVGRTGGWHSAGVEGRTQTQEGDRKNEERKKLSLPAQQGHRG